MVVLGLGSNVGDRLQHLRRALAAIGALKDFKIEKISPLYVSEALLPENAPADWDMPYINFAIRGKTNLQPTELLKLLKNIEWTIGRKPEVRHWGPRILDIDILAWDEEIIESDILTVPHLNLQHRPFALWPLADVAPFWIFPLAGPNHGKTAAEMVEPWESRFSGRAPFGTRQINQRIDGPQLMGVLNITPDSFSDGGMFITPETVLQQAEALINAGAEILDVGAIATNPRAQKISMQEEWQRLEKILPAIMAAKPKFFIPPKISVDTYNPSTAKQALDLRVDWINDQTGLDNEEMRDLVIPSKVDCLIMHHHSIPERRDDVLPRDLDPNKAVYSWAEKRIAELAKLGLQRERLVFDPGIGFGKMAEQSLEILRGIDMYKKLGVRILVGHSRKTFFNLFTNLPFAERDIETTAVSTYLAKRDVNYLRLHNVEMTARALKITQVLE